MSDIHVSRDGATSGVFTSEQVLEGLASGQFKTTDLAWKAGMTDWKPLSEWPEFQPKESPAAGPAFPGAIPPIAGQLQRTRPPEEPYLIVKEGPPWENRAELGMLKAIIETVKEVLVKPEATFLAMKTSGGLGSPLLYAVITCWFGAFFYLGFQLLIQISMGTSLGASQHSVPQIPQVMMVEMMLGMMIFAPVSITIGLFLNSGILHLSLMMFGSKADFEVTFRTVAYAIGSSSVLQAVPFCGAFVGGIWGIVVTIIGISKTHQISGGKATAAVLIPVLACCLLFGAFVFAIFAAFVSAVGAHH